METLELLTLIKTLLKTNAKKTVKLLLNLGVLDLGVELLFRHPWNSLLHLTVADMLQSLLHRVHEFPEVLSLILLNTRFLPLLFQHFQRKREMREGGGGGGRDEEEEEKEEEEEEAGRTATSSRRGEKKKGGERTAQEDGETMKEKRHEHVEGSEEEEEDGRSKEMRRKGGGRGGEEEERIQGRSLAGEGMVGMKNQKKKKKKKAMKKNKKKVRDPSGYTAHLVQVAQLLWLSLDIREVLAYLPPSWQERWDDVVVVELMYYQSILLNDTANLGEEESGCTATLPRLHANAPGLEIIGGEGEGGEREQEGGEGEQEDQEEEEEHQQVQVEEENGEEREERKDSLSLCVRMTGEKKSTKLVEEYQDHVGRHGRNKKKEPSHFYREYDYPRGGGDEEDENSSSSSSNLSVSGLSFGDDSRNSVQARTAHLEKQEEEERERLHPNQENVERIGVTMVGEEEEEEEEEQGGSAAQPFHLWV
ncbi:sit4 phosphatase-associated protein [Cystoisospora suis]|uniref:Sit4 phosphatase-associated protein n=1 Tax=Cystoisospora suis TaxID=483139 RepID=A0A2C6KST9_9APIC|nr:sit4 phosphatase-associated protein [Cystoisospora suis]